MLLSHKNRQQNSYQMKIKIQIAKSILSQNSYILFISATKTVTSAVTKAVLWLIPSPGAGALSVQRFTTMQLNAITILPRT